MKTRIFVLILAFVFIATLGFAAGKKGEVTGTSSDEPQYGGTLTVWQDYTQADPPGFDITKGPGRWMKLIFASPYVEWMLTGDVEKYGARGTGEFGFRLRSNVPEQFLTGVVAESWEITNNPPGIIYNIRKGIKFTGNPRIGMESRELTADDVVYCMNLGKNDPGYGHQWDFVKEGGIVAKDKYTVAVEFNFFDAEWSDKLGYFYGNGIIPRETVEAGAEDWKNASGSGPFIITDFTSGVGATYEKNPNYWGKTTIGGKEYQTPFVDKLIYTIIKDESTRIAALRTGKLDLWDAVPLVYEDTLNKTSPDLIKEPYVAPMCRCILFNAIDSKYFHDVNLRRAMMIGLDLKEIATALDVKAETNNWPFMPDVPEYTPVEEYPDSVKELFQYDPEKAKKMIADAGYPDGFKMELIISSTSVEADLASMLVNYWGKLGVEVEVVTLEKAAWSAALTKSTFKDATFNIDFGAAGSLQMLGSGRNDMVRAHWDDDHFMEKYWEIKKEPDLDKRTALLKETGIYVVDNVPRIVPSRPYVLATWWPWVKNYYGEAEAGKVNKIPMFKTLWIDQNLKKKMGH